MADKPTYAPLTMTRHVDGKTVERVAYDPSQEVALRFDGYRPKKTTDAAKAKTDTASTKTTDK